MRTKDEILRDLHNHAEALDRQHQDIARVAIIETEIQIDMRDILSQALVALDRIGESLEQFK